MVVITLLIVVIRNYRLYMLKKAGTDAMGQLKT